MANVDTQNYINIISEKASASTKSYMDKSCDFGNVFENVNKTYERDDKSFTKNMETSKKTNEKPEIKEKREPEEKEKYISNNSEEKNVEKTENSVENKTENSVSNDEPKTAETSDANAEKTADDTSQNKAENALETAKAVLSEIVNPAKEVLSTVVEKLTQIQEGLQGANKTPEQNIDITQITQNIKDLVAQGDKTKIQTQTQQVLSNLQTAETSTDTIEVPNIVKPEEISEKAPLIQSMIENPTESNTKSGKTAIKEALEQSNITQELLNKTNATVISVETSKSSDNSLNGNAQEQGVKLSIENLQSLNQSSNTNTTTQTTFDKSIDSMQQPKDINKADIISQIHTKFEQLKEGETTKVTIVLKPENLGKVHLELINGKDGLTARMTTENSQIKELLDKNLDTLRNSLGNQGVNVNNVTVRVAEAQQSAQSDMFGFEQREFEQNSQNNQQAQRDTHSGNQSYEDYSINLANVSGKEESETTNTHKGQVDYKI